MNHEACRNLHSKNENDQRFVTLKKVNDYENFK
jgi:hypothetical protein